MAWNPEVYDQFKEERSAPFFDLLKLVESKQNIRYRFRMRNRRTYF
jgi:trans-aconitate 2-methyltransferase